MFGKLCGAKARTNDHQPCRQPAMKNSRCRLHGGRSTGARTPEGKIKSAHANFKHGHYTNAAILERKDFNQQLRDWIDHLKNNGEEF